MAQLELNISSILSSKMSKRQKKEFIKTLAIGYGFLFGFAIIASMDEIIRRLT